MKKVMLAIGILLISFAPSATVYAEVLNSNEKEVLEAAHEIYEYNGMEYQVSTDYINQLSEYLSTEGVDLTADERDEVLVMAFSNIEQGINDGYLIPVQETDSQEVAPENTNQSENTENAVATVDNPSVDTSTEAVIKDPDTNAEEAVTVPSTHEQITSTTSNTTVSTTTDENQSTVGDGNQGTVEDVNQGTVEDVNQGTVEDENQVNVEDGNQLTVEDVNVNDQGCYVTSFLIFVVCWVIS